jgi:hypothetical protein
MHLSALTFLEPYFFLVSCIVLFTLYRRFAPKDSGRLNPPVLLKIAAFLNTSASRTPLAVSLCALVTLFALQLLLITRMDIALNPPDFIPAGTPVLIGSYLDFLKGLHSLQRHLFDLGGVLLSALETAVAYAIYRRITAAPLRRTQFILIAGCGIALYALAVFSPANCSADVYGYISSAKYGGTAYSTGSHAPFTGNFAVLDAVDRKAWKVLAPCPYGPLWLAISSGTLAYVTTIWNAIIVERCIGAVSVLLCGWAILRIRNSPGLALLFIFNPMVVFNYVTEAHNDIMALACVLIAAVSFQRPLLGIVWQAAAGLIKLPYLLIAVLSAYARQALWIRIASFGLAAILVLAVSNFFGGIDYLHALFYHVQKNKPGSHREIENAHMLLLGICLAAMAAATLRRQYFTQAPPAFLALAVTLYPWYLALIIPYVVIGETAPLAYIATLPMSSMFIDPLLGTKFAKILLIGIVAISCWVTRAYRISRDAQEKSLHYITCYNSSDPSDSSFKVRNT